jgi:hypothetical protein
MPLLSAVLLPLLLTLLLAALAVPTEANAQTPSQESLLKNLRPGHPRLLVLDSDLERVRKNIATDATAKALWEELQREGEKILSQPTVEYKLIGPRLLNQSRAALGKVYTLATLYRLDGNRKWVERAKKELFVAAAFPDWNPSHFLDVAEMTHAFAIGYDWLYPALSPEDRAVLRTAIIEKGLKRGQEAYEGTKPWKWWTNAHHNWNQVCNGGLTLGALAVADEEPALAEFILRSALKSLPKAMASFGPDGGWNEGPGYWSYTVRYTVPLIAGLESALGSDFGLATAHGFDRTGAFRMYFVGPTGRTFNYADAGDGAGAAPDMWWLARRFKEPLYAWEAKRAMSAGRGPKPLDLLWYEPVTTGPTAAKAPLDNLFRGVDVAFLRSDWESKDALFVGFKGGDNAANHSHLDLGSFVFDALGERWVVELGGDNYNLPAYFGAQRWNYYRLATVGQNTLLLNGANQQPKAKAPLVAFSSAPDRRYAVADLTAGYAPLATRVLRGVSLIGRGRALWIQDEFTANEPVEYVWQVHTPARVEVHEDGRQAMLTRNGKAVVARIQAPDGARFAVESAKPPALNGGEGPQQNPNEGITKLVVRLPEKAAEARVVVTLQPLPSPDGNGLSIPRVRPLADWIKDAPSLPKLGGSLRPADTGP